MLNRVIESAGVRLAVIFSRCDTEDPHDVPDPADFDILVLQEVIVDECRARFVGHSGDSPIEKDPESFHERSIVEVLAMPLQASSDQVQYDAAGKEN